MPAAITMWAILEFSASTEQAWKTIKSPSGAMQHKQQPLAKGLDLGFQRMKFFQHLSA